MLGKKYENLLFEEVIYMCRTIDSEWRIRVSQALLLMKLSRKSDSFWKYIAGGQPYEEKCMVPLWLGHWR